MIIARMSTSNGMPPGSFVSPVQFVRMLVLHYSVWLILAKEIRWLLSKSPLLLKCQRPTLAVSVTESTVMEFQMVRVLLMRGEGKG
jgi:hypothetical protein